MTTRRAVVRAVLREVMSIGQPIRYYRWSLTLDCGHTVDRRCRYEPGGKGGFGGMWSSTTRTDRVPPPTRVRCEVCAQ